MGYVLAIFKFFLSALCSIKKITLTPFPYVSCLSDHTVFEKKLSNLAWVVNGKGAKIGLGTLPPYFGVNFLRFFVGDPPFSFRKSIEHSEEINPTNFKQNLNTFVSGDQRL